MFYTLRVPTQQRSQVVDLTEQISTFVKESGIKDGICVVFVPHTTAGISINENADPDVKRDVLHKLDTMIPQQESFYRHGEGNSDSHLKTILTGPSVTLIIDAGRVVLGTWQGIYFCEFDGPRTRSCHVKIMGSVVT